MAAIDKAVLKPMKYVDGVPGVGQQRINWIQNGEYLGGAESPYTNEGELNRGPVKVQANVADLFDNIILTADVVDKIVDMVTIHDSIINADGDGANLFKRMDAAEWTIRDHKLQLTEIREDVNNERDRLSAVKANIGNIDPNVTYRTVRDELAFQKHMIGQYTGFDEDGNASVDSFGRGMKGQIEKNWKGVTDHETRLKSLEKWWDGNTPDVLIADVASLREEVGDPIIGGSRNIYERLNSIEHNLDDDEGLNETIDKLKLATGFDAFPIVYTNMAGTPVTTENAWEYTGAMHEDLYLTQLNLRSANNEITRISDSLGTVNDDIQSNTAWSQIIRTALVADGVKHIVGETETDGLQGEVKALDIREETHYNRLDGITQNLNDVVFNDMQPVLAAVNAELFVRPDNLVDMVRGYDGGQDDYSKFGSYEIGRRMYEYMYTDYISGNGFVANPSIRDPFGAFVRTYDEPGQIWQWTDTRLLPVTVGDGMAVQDKNGVKGLYFEKRDIKKATILGEAGNPVEIRGEIVQDLNLSLVSKLSFNTVPYLYKIDPSKAIIGDGNQIVMSIKDKNALAVNYGIKEEVVLHTGNFVEKTGFVNPTKGFDLEAGAVIQADGVDAISRSGTNIKISDGTAGIKLAGDLSEVTIGENIQVKARVGGIKTDILGTQIVDGTNTLVLGGDNLFTGLNLINSDLTSAKVVDTTADKAYAIWHDGLDAPSDGALYARKDGAWEAFNVGSGGSGGIGQEAPDNGLQYTRTSKGGVGSWSQVGTQDIVLNPSIALKATVGAFVRNLIKTDQVGKVQVGFAGGTISLDGDVEHFSLKDGITMTDGTNLVSYNDVNKSFSIGATTGGIVRLNGIAQVSQSGTNYSIWHDGNEAPRDGSFYARKNGAWTLIHDGVNPDLDVNLNSPAAYKIDSVNIAQIRTVNSDKVVSIGQSGGWTELQGRVVPFRLQPTVYNQFAAIGGTNTSGVNFNVIGTGHNFVIQDYIRVGDATVRLDLVGTQGYLNNNRIWTTADDAPADGSRYSRKDNGWAPAYYYGDFAVDAPANPQEGDVFFEFIN